MTKDPLMDFVERGQAAQREVDRLTDTPGKTTPWVRWNVSLSSNDNWCVYGRWPDGSPRLIVGFDSTEDGESQARQVAAAHNACHAVSPGNEQAVAEGIERMDKLLAKAADALNASPRLKEADLGSEITEFRRSYLSRIGVKPKPERSGG